MSAAPLVFLDANVLFSAAIGGPVFERYLRLAAGGALRLISSSACAAEAITNLERKRPGSIGAVAEVFLRVSLEDPDIAIHIDRAETIVGSDDAHVLASAWALAADALVTGDRKHFTAAMERDDLGLPVRTPARFLLELVEDLWPGRRPA